MTSPHHPLWPRLRTPLIIYLLCLGAYLGTAGGRLKTHSPYNHFVYLAQGLLEGRLHLKGAPPNQNDYALIYTLKLKDGRTLRGYFRKSPSDTFRTLSGQDVYAPASQIVSRQHTYYVSFPWFPALLMLPFVAIWGLKFNDVIFTAVVAALNPVLIFLLLRRLAALGYSLRREREDLWLTALFAFGTVHFFSAVLGQVWFTAHVVGVALTALYALCALEGRHLWLSGLFLGLGLVTRTPIPFAFPLILGEVLRRHMVPARSEGGLAPRGEPVPMNARIKDAWQRMRLAPATRDMVKVSIPVSLCAAAAMLANTLRFANPLEFGHTYLNITWQDRMQRWGLFNYHYLSRNLSVLLTLLPKILAKAPYVQISRHGLALTLTNPIFFFLLWPQRRSPLAPQLYLSILLPAILHLLYQNSGFEQFGYRFSLDYTTFIMMLLALGGRPIGLLSKSLIVYSIAVHTFGAITFHRMWQFYHQGFFPVP